MSELLLDTSIIIDFLRRKDKESSVLLTLVQENRKLSISIITHIELYAGRSVWEKKEALEELEKLFSGVSILPLQEEISRKAGEIKAKHGTNLLDAIIAATALIHRLDLVTLNVKDFENIKGISIYS
jgi:tRNA(fMet)-specific endonuclease VapC